MEFPEPVINVAIEPRQRLAKKRWYSSAKLAEEDPTFRTYTNQETGQTIIAGMGSFTLT